nr:Dihydrofolate reductase [uncultured bacterium]
MKYIIVAYDRNRAIGADNTLPWAGKMKADMARFKQLTTGNAIIMGRKTFESIGRALPSRQNIVLSSKAVDATEVQAVDSLDKAYAAVRPGAETYVIGGGQIYALARDTVDEILATEIDATIDGADAFFPVLGPEWRETSREHHGADENNAYAFDFVSYRRD